MQVVTTKDQGLYSKHSAAVHPGALAFGTLPQHNTSHIIWSVLFQFSVNLIFHSSHYFLKT